MVVTITPAYSVIAAFTVLWGSPESLGWTLKVSALLMYATAPFYIIARIRFGRAVRRSDPQLAESLGFFGRLELDGVKSLTAVNTLQGFLWRRDYRNMQDPVLRRLAAWYAAATGVAMIFATAMAGSVFVIVSIGLGFLPEP